jgi:hypothetical protein
LISSDFLFLPGCAFSALCGIGALEPLILLGWGAVEVV